MLRCKDHCSSLSSNGHQFIITVKCQTKHVSRSYTHRGYPIKQSVPVFKKMKANKHKTLHYFINFELFTVGNGFE